MIFETEMSVITAWDERLSIHRKNLWFLRKWCQQERWIL